MHRQGSKASGIVLGLKEAAPRPKRVVAKKEPKAIIHFQVKDRPPFDAKIFDNILSYFELQQAVAKYLPRHRGVLTIRNAAKDLISEEAFAPCAEYFVREIDFQGIGEVNSTRPMKWEFVNGYYAGPSDYIGKNGRAGTKKGDASSNEPAAFDEEGDVDVFAALDGPDATTGKGATSTSTTTTNSTATATTSGPGRNVSPMKKR